MAFGNLKDKISTKLPTRGERTYQKYKPEDNTYMDRFNEPDQKRAPRMEAKSFSYVWWFTGGAFIASWILWIMLCGELYSLISSFNSVQTGSKVSFIAGCEYMIAFSPYKKIIWLFGFVLSIILTFAAFYWLWRNFKVQNLLYDTSDLNQYHDTARLTQPEELITEYDFVPDAGAHSKNVDVSAILGHMMIGNQGINQVTVPKRYNADTIDSVTGEMHYKNSVIKDANGKVVYQTVPMLDKKFGDKLFDSGYLPKGNTPIGKKIRLWYDPRKLDYNKRRDIQFQPYDTLADLINNDWYIPDYEVQRPAGGYVVDSSPSNTMVMAMTRSGKG